MAIITPPGVTRAQSVLINRPLICSSGFTALAAKRIDANTTDAGRFKIYFGRAGYHSVQLMFGNYYQTASEQIDLDTVTIAAALELNSVARNRAWTFGGARNLVVAPGDIAWTDPLSAEFAGGDTAWVRTHLIDASPVAGWPVWRTSRATGEATYQQTGGTNQAYGLGALSTAGGGGSGQGFAPQGVIGVPLNTSALSDRRAVILDGDSIMAGTGDTADTTTGLTAYGKGMTNLDGTIIPHVNQGRASDQLSFQIDGNSTAQRWRKQAMWPYATHYLCNFGTNDIAASRTLAQMQADVIYIWTRAKKYGLTTAHVLVTPRQASVGGAIVSGFGAGALRDQWNAWLRTQVGGGLLDAVVDPNPYVESTGTPGTWASNSYTQDGLHMLAAGYAQANLAVQAWARSI